jgi:hypothetical protein
MLILKSQPCFFKFYSVSLVYFLTCQTFFLQYQFCFCSRVDRNDDFGGYDPLKLIQMTAAASAQDEEGNDLDDFDADDGVEDDIDQQDEDFQAEGPGVPIRIVQPQNGIILY